MMPWQNPIWDAMDDIRCHGINFGIILANVFMHDCFF